MTFLSEFKSSYLTDMAKIPSFSKSWNVWSQEIDKYFGSEKPTGGKIFDLGDKLADIFQSNKQPGREQSSLSGGGVAWECLIQWYLNLIFWNTEVVVVRHKKEFVPAPINDCITIKIAGEKLNSESDIKVLDVRSKKENSQSKVENSFNIPLITLKDEIEGINTNSNLYVYCKGGYRSMIACSILKFNNKDNIVNILGGFDSISSNQGI